MRGYSRGYSIEETIKNHASHGSTHGTSILSFQLFLFYVPADDVSDHILFFSSLSG